MRLTSSGARPTGDVVFFSDFLPIGVATLVNDGTAFTATFTTAALSRGVHAITASYVGNGVVSSGNSPVGGLVVQ